MEVEMSRLPDPRFELRKVTETEWLVLDHRYRETDPRRTLGCVYRVDENEVEVMWMRDMAVSTRYMSPFEALDDVRRAHERKRTPRPRAVPHLPPLLAT